MFSHGTLIHGVTTVVRQRFAVQGLVGGAENPALKWFFCSVDTRTPNPAFRVSLLAQSVLDDSAMGLSVPLLEWTLKTANEAMERRLAALERKLN